MGLSASMWAGVSGLLAHGERMNVVGNNIANVNTLGFKSQRMDFQDFVYQDSYSASGITQIGRGVNIGAVMGDFGQGSFETTTEVTDLAITGRGFFKVKPQGTETEYYTRAGNFRFQNDGTLTNPAGYALQGWKIDNTQGPTRATGQQANAVNTAQIRGTGLPTDIRLDTWSVQPLQTTKITFGVDLDKSKNGDKSVYLENPFASLLETWNGKQPPAPNSPPLANEAYSFPVPIKVYDEAGGVHTLTMYLDKVGKDTYNSGGSSDEVYEYILTMDPAEDLRRCATNNAAWNPGANTALPAGAAQAAASVFSNAPAAAAPNNTWDSQLKAGFVLTQHTPTVGAAAVNKYTFDRATASPPDTTYVDPAKPENWPADIFQNKTWPAQDASNNDRYVIMDMKNTKQAGILMAGTITFNQAGYMKSQTSYVLNGSNKPIKNPAGGYQDGNGYIIDAEGNPVPVMDTNNPADYMYPTEVSSSGYPMIVGNFTGLPGADTVGSVPDADKYLMEVDFGLRVSNYKNPWENNNSLGSLKPGVKGNPSYDPARPEAGPDTYSAANRVVNPNYDTGNPTLHGPQYLYSNPYYDETKNGVTFTLDNSAPNPIPANDEWVVDLNSPRYRYDTDVAVGQLKFNRAHWDGTAMPVDPDMAADVATMKQLINDGILSFDMDKNKITWGTLKATKAELSDPNALANMTPPPLEGSNAFTNNGTNYIRATMQNGYGRGELSSWTVNTEGVLSGVYSNGVTLPLYQVAIYDFTCKQGLRREGSNLFSETMDSGQPSSGVGGSNGLGTVSAQTLEGSNADLSREFVNMITTQRGFQSNSKIITTVDTMLDVVVNMKR